MPRIRNNAPAAPAPDDMGYITLGLRPLAVPVISLRVDPNNVNTHPIRNKAVIRGSLERFGQQKLIIVDANNVIIAGNGTYEMALELGWGYIAVNKTDLVGDEAVAYAIADNRASELAEWDMTALAERVGGLAAGLRLAAGFSEAEQAALQSVVSNELGGAVETPSEGSMGRSFTVIVDCDDEDAQQRIFEDLQAQGLRCRVQTF